VKLPGLRVGANHLLLAAGIVYAAIGLASFPAWTVDDAFITYRYAENLARTGQLTWNVGEDPVEGYTGVGLPVLLAGAVRVGLDADAASKAIGITSFFAGALVLYLLLRRLGVRGLLRAGLATVYLTAPMLFTHSSSGLETTLFGLAVLGTLYALQGVLDAPAAPARREVALLLASLATALVRPEGVVLAAVAVACVVAVRLAGRERLAPFLWRALALLVVPGAIYFAWRYAYYGHLLPNTYYAKWSRRISYDSIRDLGKFLVLYASAPGLAGAIGAAIGWRRTAGTLRALAVPLVGAVFFAAVAVQYSRSALIMNYSHRFFAPYYAIVLVWVGVLLEHGLSRVDAGAGGARLAPFARATAVALLAAQVCLHVALLPRELRFARSTRDLLVDEHIPAGRYLREHVPSDEWLVVVVDAGAIPYYAGLRTVDFGGLNDEFLARRFRDRIPKAAIVDYFYARNPGALVFTSAHPDRIEGPEPLPIADDPRFAGYVHVATYASASWPSYYELVFLRRDLVSESANSTSLSE
jgi:arabinofuranosyltransferase